MRAVGCAGPVARRSRFGGSQRRFVTDFGHILSLFFRDPDGLESEVCIANPDAQPGVHNPPGTPSLRYHPGGAPPPDRVVHRLNGA